MAEEVFNDCGNNNTAVAFASGILQPGSLVSGSDDRKSYDISLFYEAKRRFF